MCYIMIPQLVASTNRDISKVSSENMQRKRWAIAR